MSQNERGFRSSYNPLHTVAGVPVLDHPIVLVLIYPVPHHQYPMVKSRLGTQHTVVHPTVVELYGRGELRHVMSLNSHVTSSMTSSSIKFRSAETKEFSLFRELSLCNNDDVR